MYTGEAVSVLGKVMVKVDKDEATVTLPLLVVKGGAQSCWVETGYRN